VLELQGIQVQIGEIVFFPSTGDSFTDGRLRVSIDEKGFPVVGMVEKNPNYPFCEMDVVDGIGERVLPQLLSAFHGMHEGLMFENPRGQPGFMPGGWRNRIRLRNLKFTPLIGFHHPLHPRSFSLSASFKDFSIELKFIQDLCQDL